METKALLASSDRVAAICDPTISGEFSDITDYRKFVEMIKALGFEYVCEVSFGVDLVAARYRDLFEQFKGKYHITANCPAVVSHIEKYYPRLINNLAPIVSPMIAAAKAIRHTYGSDVRIVHIGPCIAAKDEALRYSGDERVDSVLTFTELLSSSHRLTFAKARLSFPNLIPRWVIKDLSIPSATGCFRPWM
jgi:iron only hydrogenase large subunit-like protein